MMSRSCTLFPLALSLGCFCAGVIPGHATYYPGDNFELGLKSAKGIFTANFYYLYAGENFDMASDFRKGLQDSFIRALNTIEQTFVPKSMEAIRQSGSIGIAVYLSLSDSGQPGASSEPYTFSSKKTTWDDSDFGGKFAGQPAAVNNVEALYKYGQVLDYQGGNRSDLGITFYSGNPDFGYFYVGEDSSGIQSYQRDLESLTLHEMGHVLGFNTGSGTAKSALEMQTEWVEGVLRGKWMFRGETVLNYIDGNGIELMVGDPRPDPHINPGLNNPYPYTMVSGIDAPTGSLRREYSPADLAMFKDMGWVLADDPFESIPEPSSTLLGAFGLGVFLLRRRQ